MHPDHDAIAPRDAPTDGTAGHEASGPVPSRADRPAVGSWNVGTDIVEVARIRSLLDSPGHLRWFSAAEVEYCRSKAHPERHFAGRFAAKEAIFKALALPGGIPVPWAQIEVLPRPRQAPEVVLHGRLRDWASSAGVTVRVSISHCDEYATATALAFPTQVPPGI